MVRTSFTLRDSNASKIPARALENPHLLPRSPDVAPRPDQHRVLFWGIIGDIAFRAVLGGVKIFLLPLGIRIATGLSLVAMLGILAIHTLYSLWKTWSDRPERAGFWLA